MSNKVLIISNANELVRIKPERVVYVKSDGNYSTMVLHDKTEQVFTMNLAQCQQLMEEQLGTEAITFIRLGKQLIVNRAYIFKINPTKQQLLMSNIQVNFNFTGYTLEELLQHTDVTTDVHKELEMEAREDGNFLGWLHLPSTYIKTEEYKKAFEAEHSDKRENSKDFTK